jgi:hypothetical protein
MNLSEAAVPERLQTVAIGNFELLNPCATVLFPPNELSFRNKHLNAV